MQPAAGGGHPPANVISIALPHMARNVLDNNDSVKTEGLSGLATVEYRFLVPVRRSGVILGNKGGVSAMQGTGKGGLGKFEEGGDGGGGVVGGRGVQGGRGNMGGMSGNKDGV
jgi:hypothetical protein